MKKLIYKYAHIADLHLGARPRGIRQRKIDIFNSAYWMADKIMDNGYYNGVLICGDTFHTKLVDWETIASFNNLIVRLPSDRIVIPGNHDDVKEWQWYNNYRDMLINPQNQLACKYCQLGMSDKFNIGVFGINWDTISNTTKVLDELKPKINKDNFNILMLHQAIEGQIHQNENKNYITREYLESLKEYFSYVALGHIHHMYIIDDFAFNPGSPEYLTVSEWGNKSGMFIVSIYDDKSFDYKFIETPKRPNLKIRINSDELLDKETIMWYINNHNIVKDSMLYIEFVGDKELTPKIIKEIETDVMTDYNLVLLKTKNLTRRSSSEVVIQRDDVFDIFDPDDKELARSILNNKSVDINQL